MADREKVIKGIECCAIKQDVCLECPYLSFRTAVGSCIDKLMIDALELIKEKEKPEVG